MADKTISQVFDRLIIILYFISITLTLYFSSLSQSDGEESIIAPRFILLSPFVVAVLQLLRIFMLNGRFKVDTLCRSWIYIFICYVFALVVGFVGGQGRINYNTVWFIICPPVAWCFFSLTIKANPSLKDTLITISFWFLILFSIISLYFIPRSLRANGLFASLNTGYYVLLIYPLAMLNTSRIKKIVSTVLLLIVVFLSMKRGGYVAVGLAFTFYLFFTTKLGLIKKILIAGILIGSMFFLIPKIDEMTYGTLTTRYEFTQNGRDEEGRFAMYPIVWKAVWDSDALHQIVGHGLNAVEVDKVIDGDATHNDYLEFLYDFGIVGLLLLLFYQYQLFLITWRSYKYKIHYLSSIFALSSVIVLSMVSIVYAFYYFLVIIPFWCVINRIQREERIRLPL
jgi:O-antigen ligase